MEEVNSLAKWWNNEVVVPSLRTSLCTTMPYYKTIHVVITCGTQYFTAHVRKTFQTCLICVAERREALFCTTVNI